MCVDGHEATTWELRYPVRMAPDSGAQGQWHRAGAARSAEYIPPAFSALHRHICVFVLTCIVATNVGSP